MALRILILTPRIPFPLHDGGAIAMNQTIQGYVNQGCKVSVLAMNTSRHYVDVNTLPEWYNQLQLFETVFVNNKINPLSAFFNLFTKQSYHVSRFVVTAFSQALKKILMSQTFDIIQFESIYTSPYLDEVRQLTTATCICRLHNIEHLIWQRLCNHEKNFLKRNYMQLLTKRLMQFEMMQLRKFDFVMPISWVELDFLQQHQIEQAIYLPFGIDVDQDLPNIVSNYFQFYHIGSMDWAPNQEGIEWFLQEVWLPHCTQWPTYSFHAAGKHMPNRFLAYNIHQTVIEQEVDDVVLWSLAKGVMIVPLLSGAGIRVKVLEAMAIGKTIIATPIAVEGIAVTHMENILLAQTPDEFVNMIEFCIQSPSVVETIGQSAKKFVHQHFDKQFIYSRLIQTFEQQLQHA